MEIRDNRAKEWFWLDNEYLNGYAKHLGASCTVVYLSLCRHADNKTQQCFPSMKLIAEENGISEDTVMRATKKLEEWGIVLVKRNKKEDGTQANNIYTLTAKSMWKEKPTRIKQVGEADPQIEAKPTRKTTQSRPAPLGYNYTHLNNTHITREGKISPKDKIVDFFNGGDGYQKCVAYFEEKNIPKVELQKFVSYWTETTTSGKKQRWELQPTFDVQRRLGTWLSKAQQFNKSKGKTIIGL